MAQYFVEGGRGVPVITKVVDDNGVVWFDKPLGAATRVNKAGWSNLKHISDKFKNVNESDGTHATR